MRISVKRRDQQLDVDGATAGAAPTGRRKRRMSLSVQRTLEGYFFVAPWVLGFVIFMAWPLFQSFFLSFHELQATSLSDLKFRGIDNYKEALLHRRPLPAPPQGHPPAEPAGRARDHDLQPVQRHPGQPEDQGR